MEELRGYIDKIKWEELLERGEREDLLKIIKLLFLSTKEELRIEHDGYGQQIENTEERWKKDIKRRARAKLAEKYGEDIDKDNAEKMLKWAEREAKKGNIYQTEYWVQYLKTVIVTSERLKLKDICTSDEALQKLIEKARENAKKLPRF